MTELLLKKLRDQLLNLDNEGCGAAAQAAVQAGIDPLEAINVLTETIKGIGEQFNRGDIFLPELIGAGVAMEVAMAVFNQELLAKNLQRQSLGTVVLGTVLGDLHSIGKDMVRTMLTAAGFIVHDLGIDVKADKFISAIMNHQPDLLAMSALLTTTANEQRVVIKSLEEAGFRDEIKIIVGGGAIDQSFADTIGADGYGSTAADAVVLANKLIVK